MLSVYRTGHLVVLLVTLALALFALVGCETTTAGTPYTTQYVDDSRIASDVRARLAADSASNFSRVTVTSSNGVVYLTGPVDSAERSARAARLAGDVSGVQRVVNNLQIASASPSSTVVVTPAPTTVVTSPQPVVTVPEQPAIDASGVVAQYDAQTGTVTFQDGRMVRITSASGVWGPASPAVLQPGAQVHVHNAVPVGYQPTGAQPGITSWRMGTVNRVDQANGLIYLNDGSLVHVGPSTALVYGSQRIALSQIQPGSQIAIGMSGAPVTTGPAPTVTQVTPSTSGSALPRQTVVPIESPQVQVIVVPQPR
jgi:BON domain